MDYSPYWATGYSTNPAPGSYGPGGYVINPQLDCGANAYVGSTSAMGGETWQAGCGQSGSTSGYFYAAGQTSFNRAASAPSSDCYNPATGTGPCLVFSGSTSFTLERVVADVEITPSAATVAYKDTLTVTATVTPTSAGGKDIEWWIDSVKWAPGDNRHPGITQPCGSFLPSNLAPSRTCKGVALTSGTLTVYTRANGKQLAPKSVSVTVPRPTLVLIPKPASVAPGSQATWTASASEAAGASGRPTEFSIEGDWKYQATNGATGGMGCGSNPTCTSAAAYPVHSRTQVWVKAKINGVVDSTSSELIVIDCPTGDSIADRKPVRDSLVKSLQTGRMNNNPADWREQGGWIYRDQSGNYHVVTAIESSTPCGIRIMPVPPTIPGMIAVATWHAHMQRTGEPTHGCQAEDLLGVKPPFPAPPDQFYSPDWYYMTDRINPDTRVRTLYPSYVINQDGRVWRYDPPAPLRNSAAYFAGTPEKNRWRWHDPSNNSCNWSPTYSPPTTIPFIF